MRIRTARADSAAKAMLDVIAERRLVEEGRRLDCPPATSPDDSRPREGEDAS